MTLKNLMQEDPSPANKYELQALGVIKITFTKVGGPEQELKDMELPDNTSTSSGESEPFDMTAELPLHHDAEVQAIEDWFAEGKDPVQPTHKKPGTITYNRTSGETARAYSLIGMRVKKLKWPDGDMKDSETMNVLVVTFRVDDIDQL